MKIAIGTHNGQQLNNTFFGYSRKFRIIEFKNGEIVSDEIRINPHAEAVDSTSCLEQTDKIMRLLEDCSLFMAQQMDKDSVANYRAENIDCIITDTEDIDQAVADYIYGRGEDFKYYSSTAGGFSPCSQRTLSSVA